MLSISISHGGGFMDIKLWTKALIIAYPKAEQRMEKLKMKADYYIKSCFGSNRDAEVELTTLYNIISNCKRIEYLLSILNDIIAKYENDSDFKIMLMRYRDEKSFADIASDNSLNIRTVFRKCDKAFEVISEELLDMGIDEFRCNELWGDDLLIKSVIKIMADKKRNTYVARNKSDDKTNVNELDITLRGKEKNYVSI